MAINRREAREAVFELLFETEFRADENKEEIFAISTEHREIAPDPYIHDTYFVVFDGDDIAVDAYFRETSVGG